MINKLEDIHSKLCDFEKLSPFALKPFWDHMMPSDINNNPFWTKSTQNDIPMRPLIIISGPSRNGNHLLHSMLDNHPQLCRSAGEDSFLPAFFNDVVYEKQKAISAIKGNDNIDYILNLSGYGQNKWKAVSLMGSENPFQKTDVWAGIQKKLKVLVDYQDTVVKVNYKAYEKHLKQNADIIRKATTFMEIFKIYLDALMFLDPEFQNRKKKCIYVGSGLRPELFYLFSNTDKIKCVTPIRPFENYYFSFAKGRLGSKRIGEKLINEAWDHWKCKVFDYLLLKKWFPDKICLVRFPKLIEETEVTAREVSRFLDIDYSTTSMTPTSMGYPTKGNSSFSKSEDERGTFYKSSMSKSLPEKHYPDDYRELWRMITKFAI